MSVTFARARYRASLEKLAGRYQFGLKIALRAPNAQRGAF